MVRFAIVAPMGRRRTDHAGVAHMEDGTPYVAPHVSVGTIAGPLFGALGVAAALVMAVQTGEGSITDVSEMDAACLWRSQSISVVERLAAEAAKAAKSPAVMKQLEPDAAEPIGSTPQEYADCIASEQARWREVVQKAHIKAD